MTFNGETQTGSGTTFSGTFSTPKVSAITPLPISATCTYDNFDSTGAVSDAVASDSATVTLLPVGVDVTPAAAGDAGGFLPSTGGSSLWILVVGGALVLIGGGTFVVARRRSA